MKTEGHEVKLKKTNDAVTRYTGSDAQREYTPASYDVFVDGVKVGELRGWCWGRIQGNPSGHKFIKLNHERVNISVGPRGIYREFLNEVAIQEFENIQSSEEDQS